MALRAINAYAMHRDVCRVLFTVNLAGNWRGVRAAAARPIRLKVGVVAPIDSSLSVLPPIPVTTAKKALPGTSSGAAKARGPSIAQLHSATISEQAFFAVAIRRERES